MPRRLLPLLLTVAACAQESNGCESARAFRATNRAQLVGGVAAVADIGDYVLENDHVRFVILGGHGSPGPGIFGGSLVDADLQRTAPEHRGGRGLDAFSELFPMVNLATPNPDSTEVGIAQASGGEAVVTVSAAADNYMDALELLSQTFSVPMDVSVTTDYRLKAGSRVVQIDTALHFNPNLRDAEERRAMSPLVSPPDVFGTILRVGSVDTPSHPGAVAGDFLFFGNKTDVFTPGYGFDLDQKLREVFNGGCDSINVPVGVDALAAEADGVSYAYASADTGGGKTYVPLFAQSFTAVMTHAKACEPNEGDCLSGVELGYSRLFAVGDGDAASALSAIYEAKGIATGRVSGHLFDEEDGTPVSGARVLVVKDPGESFVSDRALAELAPEESLALVYAANREATKRLCPDGGVCAACSPELDLQGAPGIVSNMKTDRRADDKIKDGDFEGRLPKGRYLLVARTHDRPTARPVRVEVVENDDVRVNLVIGSPASLQVRVLDERGEPMPAKVTLGRCLPRCAADADCGEGYACKLEERRCLPVSGCGGGQCRAYESCTGEDCTCLPTNALDVAMGDPLMPDNIVVTTFAGPDGIAHLSARPGDWELIVSRGPEYDIDFHDVALESRRPTTIDAALHRVVDSTGWVSADFHVHGVNSHDANVDHETRVLSMLGEGVELVSSSDHDAVTDFRPAIRALRAERFIRSQIGLETSTVELGHFIGAPLRIDALAMGANAQGTRRATDPLFHHDEHAMPGRMGAYDWDGLPPGEASFCDENGDGVFNRRDGERLVPKGDPTGQCRGAELGREPGIMGRLRELGAHGPEETVVTVAHPRDGFFGYFDQYALDPLTMTLGPTGTTLELLNPLVKPEFFDPDFDAIELFNGKRLDFVRTPTVGELEAFGQEMDALRARNLPNALFEKEQAALGAKWVKDVIRRTPDEQRAVIEAQPPRTCYAGATDLCGPNERFGCDTVAKRCFERCGAGVACSAGFLCDDAQGRCVAGPLRPSDDYTGVVDDWFRLLNGGVRVTGLGNSDTHDTVSIESGLPRNWVRSSTDLPHAIDPREIAASVKAHGVVASYGPFIRMSANGAQIGETLRNAPGPVTVRVQVESPLWFDVDRLELYRNGLLWQEVEAGNVHPACTHVDRVPNAGVVNFDCAFDDEGPEDAWYVAVALGLRGKDLRPVYTSVPTLALEIGDITGRAFDAIEGFPVTVSRPDIPRQHPVLPFAITNPIWVDRAGDGFDAPVPLSPESPFASHGLGSFPLTSARVGVSPLDESGTEPSDVIRAFHRRLLKVLGR